jgi:saccharopine dehydrogenase-like NADP-dependent oxidoreductase
VYELEETETFIRTTLRHPDFCKGWKVVVDLGLTDETHMFDTDSLTVSAFLRNAFRGKESLLK